MTSWTYQNKPFTENDIGDYIGFVYLITDIKNNRRYIGKKIIFNTKKKPPLKGKTRKRVEKVQSDWQDYYGSSDELNEVRAKIGDEFFTREILHLCRSKSEMSYVEAKLQFEYDVLLDDTYYNSWISVRTTSRQLRLLREDYGKRRSSCSDSNKDDVSKV